MNFVSYLLILFILAVTVGYYFDYRRNKENYKEKGQGKLYLIIIAICILILIVASVLRFS